MGSFREQCITLRRQDKSIGEIVEITGRPKSSIYSYIKDMPLSVERMRKSKEKAANRMRKYQLARKGKSTRKFRTFKTWSPTMVHLIAHIIFDGEFSHRGCIYNNRSETLINTVEESMRMIYAHEPKRWQNPRTGVYRISYYNVALGAYLKNKAQVLLRDVQTVSPAGKRAFLKAFFDDEGCMDFRPETNRRSIRGYQKDIRPLNIVKMLLQDLHIQSRIVLPNELHIVGKENLLRFEREINFSPGIYMNGRRTNSRWKRNIEKRKLLRMAIESFKN